ncbi:MAG: hypothetical protein Q9208_008708 [Pyrenodesmia sp. 3 TL-2023]
MAIREKAWKQETGCSFFSPKPIPKTKDCASIVGWEDAQVSDPESFSKRGHSNGFHSYHLEKRSDKKLISFCTSKVTVGSPAFDSSSGIIVAVPNVRIYGYTDPNDLHGFGFESVGIPVAGQDSNRFATEHIPEFQLLTIFLASLASPAKNYPNPSGGDRVNYCTWLKRFWTPTGAGGRIMVNGAARDPLQHVAYQFPGKDNAYDSEFILLDLGVNTAKEGVRHLKINRSLIIHSLILTTNSQMWGKSASINLDETLTNYELQQPDRAVKNLKDVLSAIGNHRVSIFQHHSR